MEEKFLLNDLGDFGSGEFSGNSSKLPGKKAQARKGPQALMQKSGFLNKLQLLCTSLLSFSIYVRKSACLRDAYVKLTEGTTKL